MSALPLEGSLDARLHRISIKRLRRFMIVVSSFFVTLDKRIETLIKSLRDI